MSTHRADEKRFLDDRYSTVPVCPNGLNPATILEKPVRERIVDSYFWKDQCFALNEADIVSRPFICLVFKLLQLAPSDDILKEYIGYGGEKFKYLRALGLFYVRITRGGKEVYEWLEGCLGDRRKLKRRGRDGVRLTFMDEFVDEMLTKERVCGTSLWKLPKREVLEDLEVLEPRVSELGDIEDLLAEENDDVEEVRNGDGDESERSPGDEFGEEVVENTGETMDVDPADKGDDASRRESS
ncbi:hypothetical protein ACMFMG_002284 [Clarireedia jacksonii]